MNKEGMSEEELKLWLELEWKRILYIDKLQQENKQLKEEIQELKADYENKAQVERDLLQSRIDKAIECMEKYIETIGEVDINEVFERRKGEENE